ncbi:hypothetical protein L484_000124 [Morus notabilis]|uniref:Uncharacterized protein n=1 Tax=Morus notabilis TaxID=981085 RepID=W9SN22_9ROSA|nr:hypothetical protein L484_000124 [Morus notabilis]
MSCLGDMLPDLELVGLGTQPKDLRNPYGCGAQQTRQRLSHNRWKICQLALGQDVTSWRVLKVLGLSTWMQHGCLHARVGCE